MTLDQNDKKPAISGLGAEGAHGR